MSKDAFMNLSIRVCGAEILTLANPAVRFFVKAQAIGDI